MPSEQCKLAIREYEEHQLCFTKALEAAKKSASEYREYADSFGSERGQPPGWRTFFLSVYKMSDHYVPANEHDDEMWEDEYAVNTHLAALENGLMKEYLFKVLNECRKG